MSFITQRRGQHADSSLLTTPLDPFSPSGRHALIENVDVTVETYLGSASMMVSELNALEPGGIVTLDAALNAPVELRVNGVTIAYGELVAVGDKFGVRIESVLP